MREGRVTGVQKWESALACGPWGDVWRDMEPRSSGHLPVLTVLLPLLPAERTSISLALLTLRLFPQSFVMSPISWMNRNAVTMMDGDSN